jgi:hypothetical protein
MLDPDPDLDPHKVMADPKLRGMRFTASTFIFFYFLSVQCIYITNKNISRLVVKGIVSRETCIN